jgi:hypothetical protein
MYSYRRSAWEIKKIIKGVKSGRTLEECIKGTSFFTRDTIKSGDIKTVLEIGTYYNSLLATGLGILLGGVALFQPEIGKITSITLGFIAYTYSILNIAYTKLVLEEKVKEIFT